MNGLHRLTDRTQDQLDNKVSTLSCGNYLILCANSESITMFVSQYHTDDTSRTRLPNGPKGMCPVVPDLQGALPNVLIFLGVWAPWRSSMIAK